MTATYQFNLEPSGTWHVNVSDGSFSVHEGAAEKPTTTFIMKGEDYVSMVNGDLNGQMALHDRQDEDQGCDPDGDEAQADLSAKLTQTDGIMETHGLFIDGAERLRWRRRLCLDQPGERSAKGELCRSG